MSEVVGVRTVHATVLGCRFCHTKGFTLAVFGPEHVAAQCSIIEPHLTRGVLILCTACGRGACMSCLTLATQDLTAGAETTLPPQVERAMRGVSLDVEITKAAKPS